MSVGPIGGGQPPQPSQSSQNSQSAAEAKFKQDIDQAKADLQKSPPDYRDAYMLLQDAKDQLGKLSGSANQGTYSKDLNLVLGSADLLQNALYGDPVPPQDLATVLSNLSKISYDFD